MEGVALRIPAVKRLLAIWISFAALAAFAAEPYRLIGHRGGVVEDKFPDNSAAALHGAIARNYWGIEIDIRETKDGVLVMQHDPDLRRNFGNPRIIFESTWEELQPLRTRIANQLIWRFDDVVQAAQAAGLRLMLDSKDPHTSGFPAKVEAILKKYGMVEHCYIIGTDDVMNHFVGKALVGRNFGAMRALIEADPAAKDRYFLFDVGGALTAERVKWTQDHGVRVVPSINVYHYYDPATMAGKSREELKPIILAAARRHIEALKALGVTEFQIDSEFDGGFD